MTESESVEEMARIAEMAVKIRRFLDYIASSYSFFIYALGVIGFIFTVEGVAEVTGGDQQYFLVAGTVVGVLVSTYLHILVVAKVTRTIRKGDIPGTITSKYFFLIFILIFAFIGGVAYIIGWLYPKASTVSWYPPLAIFLLTLHYFVRMESTKPHLMAGVLMICLTPLVVYTGSNALAVGTLMLSYLFAGTYGVYKALEELGG